MILSKTAENKNSLNELSIVQVIFKYTVPDTIASRV